MVSSIDVLTISVIFLLNCSMAVLAVEQRDARMDVVGTCTTGLLKNLSDSSFTASSVLRNDIQFAPQAAMSDNLFQLGTSRNAWCPNQLVTNQSLEWLQVDFTSTKIIKNIFTQGRDDGNYGEYVTNYYFDYQREDGLTWYRYRDGEKEEIIKGNNDARNLAHKKFDSPLVAKRIRIIPISLIPTRVCLKIVLYGCDFNDGVVEYRIPRGNVLSHGKDPILFDDDQYDGRTFSNKTWLQGGMGKLMDNVIPMNSSNQNEEKKFFVAWDQTLQTTDNVELFFRFDQVRKFRSVLIYPASVSSLTILPFLSVTLELTDFKFKTATVKISPSFQNEEQPIKINLHDKVGKFIKMNMYFRSRWMGLNEIVFESEPAIGVTVPWFSAKPIEEVFTTIIPNFRSPESSSNLYMHIIVIACFVGVFIIVAILTIICFLWVRQRKKRRYKSKLCDYRSMLMNDTSYPSNIGNINTISGKSPMLYGPVEAHVFGPNSSSTVGFRYIHPSYPPCQDYRPHSSNNSCEYEPIDSYWPKPPSTLPKNLITDQVEKQTFLVPGAPDVTNNIAGCGPIYCSTSTYSSHPYDASLPVPDIIPPTVVTQDTFTDIFNIHVINPLQGLLGSSLSSCHLTPVSPVWIEAALFRLSEIHPTSIIFQKHVSEGEIGHISSGIVQECEVGIIVAQMKRNITNLDLKYSFYRHCLATIKVDFSSHPNLLPIIGQSSRDSSILAIMYGYPSQVNVISFFHKLRQIPRSGDVSFACSYVSQSSLLYLMKQLADALAFLAEAGVVHRDVSARNCSIGDRFHLILSDFAIGLEEFQDDYVSFSPPQEHLSKDNGSWTSTVTLPLLWMPWEAIIMGNFSTKSDVWSFGVTLWEIFTECQLKPYFTTQSPSNHDISIIVKNAMLIASSHPSSILPNGRTFNQTIFNQDKGGSQVDISKQIRDIMHLCWQPNPSLRPEFQSLYSILSELSPESRYVDEFGTLHRLIS